ncbi:aspartyl-tRNA(Asn)/glutamyl-tRNA(Gln) amidotransferase subunit A [Frankia sp. EI5c]|uniref:amidase n=1 Tax=Frankia sp. EI5c TaxID=683316 RepID=UPI0007C3BA36|nr:amidase [Frankia sp. EI5c]OAA29530.1 aspartyl-tRNA(Asn)/glutamyl-tRNA(Gln) amidotransferase subunit A [Frankia sp. EI5c]
MLSGRDSAAGATVPAPVPPPSVTPAAGSASGPAPWAGDAIALVDSYRRGDHDPAAELEAALAAVARSRLGAVCHVDADAARRAAREVDLSLPLAGVPFAVKELEQVAGWPRADASVPLRGRRSVRNSTQVQRLIAAGAIPVVQTTSSELARGAHTLSRLHGVTRNPWRLTAAAGGSSGGSAAVVAGGLLPLATSTDGGGSTRQPAALCGLPGLKVTWRIVPGGPEPVLEPFTVVTTTLTRSVRDLARALDLTAGFDSRDPFSAPLTPRFEAGLGTVPTTGLRVAWLPGLGGADVAGGVLAVVEDALRALVGAADLRLVDLPLPAVPGPSAAFAAIAALRIRRILGPYWPDCADELTDEIRAVMESTDRLDARVLTELDTYRTDVIETMASLFDQVDLVACPTTGEAFDAETGTPEPGPLTLANVSGCPAISIPAGTGPSGLPVGLHLFAPHHRDDLLLELAASVERDHPWPLVAPGSPC